MMGSLVMNARFQGVQMPAVHAWLAGQTMPQPPQFWTSSAVGVSQPGFILFCTQSAKPGRHSSPADREHERTAFRRIRGA